MKFGNGLGEHACTNHRHGLLCGYSHKLLGGLRLRVVLIAVDFGEMEGSRCQTPQIDDGVAVSTVGQGGDKRFDPFPNLAGIRNAKV